MTWEQEAHLKYLEGAQQQALEIAENLLKENIPPEIIARCTGLPLNRILEQQKQLVETVSD